MPLSRPIIRVGEMTNNVIEFIGSIGLLLKDTVLLIRRSLDRKSVV